MNALTKIEYPDFGLENQLADEFDALRDFYEESLGFPIIPVRHGKDLTESQASAQRIEWLWQHRADGFRLLLGRLTVLGTAFAYRVTGSLSERRAEITRIKLAMSADQQATALTLAPVCDFQELLFFGQPVAGVRAELLGEGSSVLLPPVWDERMAIWDQVTMFGEPLGFELAS